MENSSRDGNTRPPDLPLEKLYAGQEATVRTGHGTTDWFQIGKGECQGCILSPCLFNLHAEYIMQNARLDEAQAGIKTARRNIKNLRYADDTTLMAEREEELKSLLMKVKEESEKVVLKLSIQKTKIMTSSPITSWQIDEETMETVRDLILGGSKITEDGDCSHEIKRRLLFGRKTMIMLSSPITSWQIDGETMETVTDFIFLGSKITADGDCSHEIKRHLLLGRKIMTNLDSILKSRDITLPTKVCLVKVMVFPVVMYGCESWTIKKAEH